MCTRKLCLSLILASFLVLTGCEIPAQTHWSPDGKLAAYLTTVHDESKAVVIDENGKIISNLGLSTGGFTWSADSKKLYFASVGEKPQGEAPFEKGRDWRNNVPEQKPSEQPAGDADEKSTLIVSVWDEGHITPLFWLDQHIGWYMRLSPDQKWLALVTFTEKPEESTHVFVFSLQTERLYALCTGAGKGICFTGHHRLAFVEPNELHNGKASDIGQLVEVELDDNVEKPERSILLAVLMPVTPWLQAIGDDILMTSFQFTFPGPLPEPDPEDAGVFKLFRYSRADKSVKVLADNVGDLFLPSPDGKLILLEKKLPAKPGDEPELQLAAMETATGAMHVLRDLPHLEDQKTHTGLAAYPAWRGNDQITFTAPVNPAKPPTQKDDRSYLDLVLYRLTADYKLLPIRTLSEQWDLEMMPSFKTN